ncbi:MAG TPA: FAD binding domain-containing protein [Kofleriaceae bacterium]|nr:FAD binding domain-containing protein [Kofleriaceae bacterium]
MASYQRPARLADALAALAAGPHVIVAGGTNFYAARVGQPLAEDVLDISGLTDLRQITDEGTGWRIPALATWTDVIEAELPPLFDGLKLAARGVGSKQIQNVGTICGNLCNASAAADGVPALLALDAEVELASCTGARRLGVADFVTGHGTTARRADELVVALRVSRPPGAARSTFLKLGARTYLAISIAMVAVVIETDAAGTISAARIAIGSCAAVAKRLHQLERELAGRRLVPDLAQLVTDHHFEPLAPIDDIRGSALYRRDAALTLTRRALAQLAEQPV